MRSFNDYGLLSELLSAITQLGYKTPTPIQEQVIPKILERRDLIAIAPTGTGKTAAFTLPILQRLTQTRTGARKKLPFALVLTPTRELAVQVFNNILAYGENLSLDVVNLYGGVSYDAQLEKLQAGVDIIVATPGRLRDLFEKGTIDFSELGILVLDEADRMLDMGFIEDVEVIINKTPKSRQTLLFSATFSDDVRGISQKFLNKPASVHATPQAKTAPKVTHIIHPVDPGQKTPLLIHLIQQPPKKQILVFTRTKVRADEVAKAVTASGVLCMATHSDRTQAYRTKAMACFKDGRIQVLVATDIAARGLDIDDLSLVINYEIPNLPEDYVHRIGRTGRAGVEGSALSLLTQDELYLLGPIEQLIKASIPQVWVEGFAPKNFDPRKVEKSPGRRQPKKPASRQSKGRKWG
jgi:ATP-dependent RNA helicase RhlE